MVEQQKKIRTSRNDDKYKSAVLESEKETMRVKAQIENSRQDNKSRSRIAYGFTFAFIGMLGLILVGGPIYNAVVGPDIALDITELITTFVAQFGTPLGFVLGYYFKDQNSK